MLARNVITNDEVTVMVVKSIEPEREKAIKAAKELWYSPKVVEALESAKSTKEIKDILWEARHSDPQTTVWERRVKAC